MTTNTNITDEILHNEVQRLRALVEEYATDGRHAEKQARELGARRGGYENMRAAARYQLMAEASRECAAVYAALAASLSEAFWKGKIEPARKVA